jgi:hypothetical protein
MDFAAGKGLIIHNFTFFYGEGQFMKIERTFQGTSFANLRYLFRNHKVLLCQQFCIL